MREPAAGVALLCDPQGEVTEVLRDGLGIGGLAPGRTLRDIVDPECARKAEAFLGVLRAQNAAFNWELNVPVEGGHVAPLHFAGGATDRGYLVIGARSRSAVANLYEELLSINNEQTNALRAAMKDLSLHVRSQAERDSRHYDELSHLNNELANAQRELSKSNFELARLNEQKNQFLGVAAHDLRNPLEVILTYSRFLQDEAAAGLSPEHLEFLRIIRSSSEFMLNLVDDLLDVAKIEAGKLELDLASVDLARLVEDNVARNRTLAESRGIAVELRKPAAALRMELDAAKIEQVLNNLIGNAVKFSPAGTTVEVSLESGEEGARISIRDQGPGLAADEVEKLFRPFERGHARGARGEKSTGLGLAIVQRIVEGHRGRIEAESEPGRGATFRVWLPRGTQGGEA